MSSPHKLREAYKLILEEEKMDKEKNAKAAFRAAFEKRIFGLSTGEKVGSPQSKTTSKAITRKEWELRVHLLSNWDNLDKKEKELHHSRYKNWKYKFSTTRESGVATLWHDGKKKGKNGGKKRTKVVAMEDVFTIIYNYHVAHSHQGGQTLHLALTQTYYNITLEMVKEFAKLCPVCALSLPKKLPQKGAVKPIDTYSFRDRFLLDLIDYSMDPQPLYWWDTDASPMMHYLLVIKDHFTKFVYAVPIPQKSPRHVAREAIHFFSVVGYPLIWHTDNGKEFINECLQVVKEVSLC